MVRILLKRNKVCVTTENLLEIILDADHGVRVLDEGGCFGYTRPGLLLVEILERDHFVIVGTVALYKLLLTVLKHPRRL